ncbi:MAG: DedA family protein, partial [Actinomycetota bacterium]
GEGRWMELISSLREWVLLLDDKLTDVVELDGLWTYFILFAVVFCETGLVVTPFLPGDSLLFVAGALAGGGRLNVGVVVTVVAAAAIIGDTVNYQVGGYLGPKIFREGRTSRWLRREHLDRTHRFFERYGAKTIIIARFVPVVRTFAPFVAGLGSMSYPRFLTFNVLGALLWVVSLVLAGYWFGGLESVRENFSLVIIAIIIISLAPATIGYLRGRRQKAIRR